MKKHFVAILLLVLGSSSLLFGQNLELYLGPARIQHKPFYNGGVKAGVTSPNKLISNGWIIDGEWYWGKGRLDHHVLASYQRYDNFELTSPRSNISRPNHHYYDLQLGYQIKHDLFGDLFGKLKIRPGGFVLTDLVKGRLRYPDHLDQDYLMFRAAGMLTLALDYPVTRRLTLAASTSNGGYIGGIRHRVPHNEVTQTERDLGWVSRARGDIRYRLSPSYGLVLSYHWEQWLGFNQLHSNDLSYQSLQLGLRYTPKSTFEVH